MSRRARVAIDAGPYTARLLDAADKAVARVAAELASDAAGKMPGAGAAKMATRTGRVKYIPSTPGQPPGVRNDDLRGSITWAKSGKLRYRVGTNVKYGRWLEFGTTGMGGDTIRMPARPFLRPTLDEQRTGLGARIARYTARNLASAVTPKPTAGAQ